nr:hypothetical protein [Tanacetum cinerariifolium]
MSYKCINAARLSKLLLSGKCVICLPNEEIFTGLAQMGYEKPSTKLTFYKAFFFSQWKFLIHTILQSLSAKRTSWNEFSTAMASAVICLSKEPSWRLVNPHYTLHFPCFDPEEEELGAEQVQVDAAVAAAVEEDVAEDVAHMATPSPPPHGILSPPQEPSLSPHQPPCPPQPQDAEGSSLLFQQVLDTCSALARKVEGLENDKAAQQLEIFKLKARVKKLEKINMVKSSKLIRLKKDEGIELVADQEKDAKVEGRHADKHAELYNSDQDHSSKVLSMQEDDTEVQEAVEIVTTAKLMTEVVTAAATQVVAASIPIPAAKPKILNIAAVLAVSTRRRKGVVIRDPKEELHFDTPAETPKVKDKGKGILIKALKSMKKKDQIEMDAEYARKLQYHGMKKKPQTESEVHKNMIFYLKNTEGYKMDFFKGMKYDEILPIFQAKFDANMRFLFKSRDEMEAEDQEIIKSINETPA